MKSMTTKIDPRFARPPVIGVEYDERNDIDNSESSTEDTFQDGSGEIVIVTEDATAPTVGLEPPSNVTVVSQTVKVNAGGQTTVDIVFNIPDVPGAAEYEHRGSTS